MSGNKSTAQSKDRSGEPLHPQSDLESAGGTYENYMWV